jgi:acid phosphatase (class A)
MQVLRIPRLRQDSLLPVCLLALAIFSNGVGVAAIANFTPASEPYARLSRIDAKPSAPDLPLDQQRFVSNPAVVDQVNAMPSEFLHIPLEEFELPACPANSSAQTRAEIDYLLQLQANRTVADGAKALRFADWGHSPTMKPDNPGYAANRAVFFQIGRSLGPWFNANSLPRTANLMSRVWRDAHYHIWSLKYKYARIRPVVIDSRVKNLQRTEWPAFPSGHASNAYVIAYVFSTLAPEFTTTFLRDAQEIAHSREIIGVHYPSDTEAGRMLARQFVNRLLQNAAFRAELDKVRKEWTRARSADSDD